MSDEERSLSFSESSSKPDRDAPVPPPGRERVRAAIDEASDEIGLEIWYRSCAEPLITLADADFPACCGANCEPCNMTLIEVALRARKILATDRVKPHEPSR